MDNSLFNRWILGLLSGCPAGEPDCNCPLNVYREVGFDKMVDFIKHIPLEESISYISYHRKCLNRRENSHLDS